MINVGDAGGGELKASINGPSKAHITLTDYQVKIETLMIFLKNNRMLLFLRTLN